MSPRLILLFLAFCTSLLVHAQTKEIYTNPQFNQLTAHHKVLAILPFKAIVKLRPKQMEAMTADEIEKMHQDEGMAAQSAMESYFLGRKSDYKLKISFQPLITTNALLGKNGINEGNIETYTPQELCKFLGVDGIMNGLLSTDKPMSEGASLAMGLLVGYYGATNSGKCTINAFDGT